MKKKIYFVQPGLNYGKAVYLPYATGCLAAYALQDERVCDEYALGGFVYRRDAVPQALARIKSPYLVAFSCYTWTTEYNKVLAKELRALYPDCIMVFGGHNIPWGTQFFDECPEADFLIYGEGEVPFRGLLRALAEGNDPTEIPGISMKKDGLCRTAAQKMNEGPVAAFPSPYLLGYFDDIYHENPDLEFCAVLETNRGCPYHCAYCDWCFSTGVREFPMKKIKAELEWFSAHRVEYIFCADANFGILKRDLETAEYVVGLRKRTSYPQIFGACYAKNSNDTVFEISKMFYENRINKAATLAYQTVCPEALENVGRKNFTLESFSELVRRYNEAGIPTYTEMILGLPGETYESFCEGLCRLVENGQQSALTVYYCQVYPNSLMGSAEYRKKYGIVTARVPLNNLHASEQKASEIIEYTDLVIETATMNRDAMIRAILFCTALQCFHHIGLLKCFAMYLRLEQGISYLDFYSRLLDYIFTLEESTLLGGVFRRFRDICADCTQGEWTYNDPRFGETGWFLEEGAFLELVYAFDRFWDEITPFLDGFGIAPDVYAELRRYQRFIIRRPEQTLSAVFDYDFYNYFFDAAAFHLHPLKKVCNRLTVDIPNSVDNWKDYARVVMLYAKRRGDTLIVNARRFVHQEFIGEYPMS